MWKLERNEGNYTLLLRLFAPYVVKNLISQKGTLTHIQILVVAVLVVQGKVIEQNKRERCDIYNAP